MSCTVAPRPECPVRRGAAAERDTNLCLYQTTSTPDGLWNSVARVSRDHGECGKEAVCTRSRAWVLILGPSLGTRRACRSSAELADGARLITRAVPVTPGWSSTSTHSAHVLYQLQGFSTVRR